MCSFRPVKAEQYFTDQNVIFLDEQLPSNRFSMLYLKYTVLLNLPQVNSLKQAAFEAERP